MVFVKIEYGKCLVQLSSAVHILHVSCGHRVTITCDMPVWQSQPDQPVGKLTMAAPPKMAARTNRLNAVRHNYLSGTLHSPYFISTITKNTDEDLVSV